MSHVGRACQQECLVSGARVAKTSALTMGAKHRSLKYQARQFPAKLATTMHSAKDRDIPKTDIDTFLQGSIYKASLGSPSHCNGGPVLKWRSLYTTAVVFQIDRISQQLSLHSERDILKRDQ